MSLDTFDTARSRLASIRDRIGAAAQKAGREPSAIQLLAVSKFHPREKIAELLDAGQQLFGENYVQEAKGKYEGFLLSGGVQPHFHCIGHLQRNKSKDAARIFDCIQTVDRI